MNTDENKNYEISLDLPYPYVFQEEKEKTPVSKQQQSSMNKLMDSEDDPKDKKVMNYKPSLHFNRKNRSKQTHFILESQKNTEEEEEVEEKNNEENKQNRFKFSRKKRESKTNNYLIIESPGNTIALDSPNSSRFNILIPKKDDAKFKYINEMLEAQKKQEMNRYLYEHVSEIISKKETSFWIGEPEDFNEPEEYQLKIEIKEEKLETSCFLEVQEMTDLERQYVDLENMDKNVAPYKIRSFYLSLRKKASALCLRIVKHPLFEITTVLVIIMNCIEILIDNSSLTGGVSNTTAILTDFENFFFAFYIIELSLKVIALGFIMNEGAYLKDGWNFLDFFIITTAIINKIVADYGINLKALRSLRVLRPLKVIASLKQLQRILESLFQALPLLADSFFILIFCYMLYALAGLQLFPGLLKKRCIYSASGLLVSSDALCGNISCPDDSFCGKTLDNPNFGIMNFDNIFYSFMMVFEIVTLDNWTEIMYSMQKTFTNYCSFYFLTLVIIGGLFLVNLTLAIIKVKFSGLAGQIQTKTIKKTNKKIYSFLDLRKKKVWMTKKPKRNDLESQKTSLKQLDSISKSAKTSKKSNNPFSMRLLSNLKLEIGKIANNVGKIANNMSSYALGLGKYAMELGKEATKNIGKTVGVNKLFRAMDKISPIRFWKKNEALLNFQETKKIEELDPKYLKLEVNSSKEYVSESLNDVLFKSHKKDFLKVFTNRNYRRTNKLKKNSYQVSLFYRVPRYCKPEPEKQSKIMKLPLVKGKVVKLTKITPVEIVKNSLKKLAYRARKAKILEVRSPSKKMQSSNGEAKALAYNEAVKKINEQIDDFNGNDPEDQLKIFNNSQLYDKLLSGNIKRNFWSGNPVLRNSFSCRQFHVAKIISSFQRRREEVTSLGLERVLVFLTLYMGRLVNGQIFIDFVFLVVLMNGVLLCLEGLINENLLYNFNYFFTCVFTIEMIFKLIGLGVKSYFRDIYNKMDFLIAIISISEILLQLLNMSFQSLRFIRSIRVFRIFRLLRSLDYVRKIASFIYKNFSSFIYIAFLLLLFNFVYGLLGMDLFTNITVNDPSLISYSFQDFSSSFMCAFDLLTLDNWSSIYIVGRSSDAGLYQTAIYCISWIFIGNYILMNLFLAVLLDGLTNELIATEDSNNNRRVSDFSLEKTKDNVWKEVVIPEASKHSICVNEARKSSGFSDENLIRQVSQHCNSLVDMKANDYLKLLASKCDYSLFIFAKNNILRRKCHFIVFHAVFETVILIIIMVSSVKMVVETYMDSNNEVLLWIDNTTTLIFVIECLMKVIAKGFFLHEDTYLRESWNQLDFTIVISSVVSWIFQQINVPFMKVIRILRVMRPLRFISKNANIKIVVVALLESLHGILNVFLIIFVIFIMFASFGVSIYSGRFGYCGSVLNFNVPISKCPSGQWTVFTYNFDNIVEAMFTLLVIATFNGWMPILGVAINSNTSDYGPTLDNARNLSNAYFVLFIIVIPIFFINLFIGVIFYHFVISEKKSKNVMMTESQIRWIHMQKLIIYLEPKYAEMRLPVNPLRRICYKIVNHRYFEEAILMVICGSIINMALVYDDCPEYYASNIDLADQIFMLVFVIEILLKLFAFRPLGYFSQRWNQFDFFIVVFGLVDLLINRFFSQQLQLFEVGQKILRAIRILRIGRLLRLVKKFDGMLKLLQTLVFSLPMTFNVLALLLLVFFVYAIIGCSLFGDYILDEYVNFKNFLYSMMTLFKMSTTDNWSDTMLKMMPYSSYCPLYFVSFIIISQFILTNLFILVLLQQFEDADSNTNTKSPIQEFHEYVDKFRAVWIQCTEKTKGLKLKKTHLLKFFRLLESPLGFKDEENIDVIAKFIMEMKIQGDKDGFVYFNELLFKTMRNVYGAAIFETDNESIISELKKQEKKTTKLLALRQNKSKRVRFYKRFFKLNRASMSASLKPNKENIINPLEDYLYIHLCFSSWRKFTLILREKAERCVSNDLELVVIESKASETNTCPLDSIQEEENEANAHYPSEIHSENNNSCDLGLNAFENKPNTPQINEKADERLIKMVVERDSIPGFVEN